MITLLIISAIICLGYTISTKIAFKEDSISQSYYHWKNIKESLKDLFFGWTVLTAFSILPVWLELTPKNYQFIAFLSSASLMFVGAFPKYLEEHRVQHFALAFSCIILSVLWGILLHTWYIPTLLILPILIWKYKKYDLMWWLELAAILAIYIQLFIKLL